MLFGQSFFQNFWPTKTNGILGTLAFHYKLLGVFLSNDSAQINFCNLQIMQCIVYHSNPIDGNANNVFHAKNKGLMSYIKNHKTYCLKKHVSHEHVEEGKRWDLLRKKLKEIETNKNQQKKGKMSFSNH
jgi:hypothetical protein